MSEGVEKKQAAPEQPRGLSNRLTNYGDRGFSLFLRESFLGAEGYNRESLDKPIVGIAQTDSDFNPCHGSAPALADAIKRGVLMAGGLPMVFPTISLHESFAHPTSMLLRNLMAIDTEEMLRALPVDSAVLIGGCDKTVPAQIMGAVSANLPTQIQLVGSMLSGSHEGERLGACTDCRRLWSAFRAEEIDGDALGRAQSKLMPTHGTCMVMGTASTMGCLAEILGFMPLGASTAPAVHSERLRLAEDAGRLAVAQARAGGPGAGTLVTEASLRNAVVLLQALGGSTNALIHLAAIAGRAGISLGLEMVDAIGRKVPVLLDLKPVGRVYMQDFHAAGGTPALLRNLRDFLDLDVMTADGRTLGEALDASPDWVDEAIVRPLDRPVVSMQALTILKGTLAPGGAVLKTAAATEGLFSHRGPAFVFDGLDDLEARIDDPDLPVTRDHVLLLRNVGPVGAPGMPEAGAIPIPKVLARQGVKDMVRISDARMSGTAFGTVILHAAPEAARGGPLALVRDGDIIELDVENRRLDLCIEQDELDRRMSAWQAPDLPLRGYARLYADHVMGADAGCDFDFLTASGKA